MSQPEIREHWGRLIVSYLAPISDRVWNPDAVSEPEPVVDLTGPSSADPDGPSDEGSR
jgi:hypothetical protein